MRMTKPKLTPDERDGIAYFYADWLVRRFYGSDSPRSRKDAEPCTVRIRTVPDAEVRKMMQELKRQARLPYTPEQFRRLAQKALQDKKSLPARLVAPPGHTLLQIAGIFLPKKQYQRCEEHIADMREEIYEAHRDGKRWRARIIPFVYYAIALWSALSAVPGALLDRVARQLR